MTFTIEFLTIDEVNLILNGVGQYPYNTVKGLMEKIGNQVRAQMPNEESNQNEAE